MSKDIAGTTHADPLTVGAHQPPATYTEITLVVRCSETGMAKAEGLADAAITEAAANMPDGDPWFWRVDVLSVQSKERQF